MLRSLMRFLFSFALLMSAPTSAAEPTRSADRLFEPDHLVDVQIEMAAEDWDKLRLQSRSLFTSFLNQPPGPSPFQYVKADVTIDGLLISDVGIRKKGFLGSLDSKRPSLKIKFDKYVDQAPFAELDRLTLNNNKQDLSQMSQFLSYKLFRESGTAAPRCNFAKVTVNGQYLGIYSNVESIKPPMLQRCFGDGTGDLFEGTVVDLVSDRLDRIEPKTDCAVPASLSSVCTLLQQEPLDLEQLDSEVDVDAFIRFWAMESLIGFWDGYTHNQNNFFMYRDPSNAKLYFMPWGADSAFTYLIPPQIDQIQTRSVHHQSVLANRLYHDPRTRELYYNTLTEFLQTHWNEEALLAEVDRVEALLKPEMGEQASGFEWALGSLRKFIKGRRSRLEEELKRWPIPLTTGPRQPPITQPLGRAHATFATQWFAEKPSELESHGEVEIDLEIDGEPVTFRQIGAVAVPDERNKEAAKDGTPAPSILLTGLRESDGMRLTLAMGLITGEFPADAEQVQAMGILIEGSAFWLFLGAFLDPSGMTFLDGWAEFEQAGTEPGTPVKGKLDLTLIKFVGGDAPTVVWKTD